MPKLFSAKIIIGLFVVVLSGCAAIPLQTQVVSMPDSEMRLIQAQCVSGRLASAKNKRLKAETMLNPQKISLLNWNAYKGQGENWLTDFSELSRDHDIVVLQEALLSSHLYQLLQEKKFSWNLNAAFLFEGKEAGVLTASRVRAISSCGIRTTEPIIRTPKTILVSRYRLANRGVDLMVANIHGINFTLGTEIYQQQINALTQAIKNHAGPVIVAGDFNSWSDDRMAIVNQMVDELFLNDIAYKNHNRITIFGNAIDHVFYRGLELIEEKTFNMDSSDHNPISVSFSVLADKFSVVSNE